MGVPMVFHFMETWISSMTTRIWMSGMNLKKRTMRVHDAVVLLKETS